MTKQELYERDYRDICYFIKHVKDIELRIDILKQLGYKMGVDVVTKDSAEMKVIVGKRNEKRIQVTPVQPKFPLVVTAILKLT